MLSMFSVFPRRKGLLEHMAAATVHMTGQTGKNTHTHTFSTCPGSTIQDHLGEGTASRVGTSMAVADRIKMAYV